LAKIHEIVFLDIDKILNAKYNKAELRTEAVMAEKTGKRNKKSFYVRHRDGVLAFLLLGVPILWWVALSAFPLIFGVGLGFFEWTNVNAAPKFVWFDNFVLFFKDAYYYKSLLQTFLIGGLCFLIGMVLGLALALVLNKIKFLKSFFRSVWYIPVITATVATSQIFQILLDPYNGVLNNLLIKMGLNPVIWNLEYGWSVFWIVVYTTWKGLGGTVLMWLAALQSVDASTQEAAQMDGAGKATVFFKITLPQMGPIAVYILINSFIGAMQIYEQVLFISNGGPSGQTAVLAYRIMRLAFWDNNFGMAGACSVIMLLVTFVFTLIVFRKQKESV